MACFKPLQGYRSKELNKNGKRSIVFNVQNGYIDMPVTLPCGRCIGCKLERSKQWAIRCMHEAALHEDNCFITLTFAPEHYPPNGSLDKSHFQKFMKRLRKKYPEKKIKYYMCGEYGDQNGRPHYHAILFNHDFPDRELYSVRKGIRLDTSDTLSKLWPFGFNTIGNVTFESAAYVARYVTKKITGEKAEQHYKSVNQETGEMKPIIPEYNAMSLKDAIGKNWFDQFKSEVYPRDYVIQRGQKMRPPKYYDGLYEREDEDGFRKLKNKRVRGALQSDPEEQTTRRLQVKEKVTKLKLSQLIRGFEND